MATGTPISTREPWWAGPAEVSVLHNVVHLLFGVVGLLLARTPSGAVAYLIGGGAVYLVLWLYGVVVDKGSNANFVPVNSADDWLHLALGVLMVAAGLVLRARVARPENDDLMHRS